MEELDGTPLKFKTAACFVKRFYPRGNVEAEDVKQASDEESVVSEDLVEQQVSGVDDEVDEDGVDDDDEHRVCMGVSRRRDHTNPLCHTKATGVITST